MIYRFLADSVLIVHLLFIGFVVFGGLFALRFRWVALVHIPAACWGAYIELAGGLCPLTTIEVGFRRMAGDAGYSGSFIDHYLLPIIYPAGLTRDIQLWLGGLSHTGQCCDLQQAHLPVAAFPADIADGHFRPIC